MVSAVTNTTNSTPPVATPTPTAPSNSLGSIGKDQFLKLLVTQLKNQDPLSPMQPNEFAAQLAQFSSVEQLIQLNDSMANQSAAVQLSTLSGQAALGASLIGRQVVAEGNDVVVPASGKAAVRVDVGGMGGAATLTLKDAQGNVVATRDLGSLRSGHQTVTLPADLPPGTYTYAIAVKDGAGANVSVTTYTTGVVDAVQFDNSQILLRLGELKVPLGNVAEIDPAP